ncbi:MAG: type II toxin-antitoxin system RelE/ParE family toxin [Planctomycetes bacterium]|nr:type II toxin-antitoxin system RelE/ParE family toxin [Planctomycetota bacterium]
MNRTLLSILENPNRYPRVPKSIRRALTRRFPYGVFYLVEKRTVVVLAVLHQAMSPSHWQSRW